MPDLLPSLTSFIIPRLGQERSIDGGIREWLVRGRYEPAASSTATLIVLENFDPISFADFLAFDYSRFALSSYESFKVASIEASHHGLLGWPTIKGYYSAFFAAHAIMRSLGGGVMKLEKKQVDTINEYTKIVMGHAIGISAGMFFYQTLVDPAGSLKITVSPHQPGAGVHDAFWRTFSDFLSSLAQRALTANAAEAGNFVAGTQELAVRLGSFASGGARAWFSDIRNSVNYQHELGVWYPVLNVAQQRLAVERLEPIASNLIALNSDLAGNPHAAFVDFSRYLACLNCDIAEWLAARSTKQKAFGSTWRSLKNKLN
jgi:hypothetical protein